MWNLKKKHTNKTKPDPQTQETHRSDSYQTGGEGAAGQEVKRIKRYNLQLHNK